MANQNTIKAAALTSAKIIPLNPRNASGLPYGEMEIELDELPLVETEDGLKAWRVNGRAVIEYELDGLWSVGAVTVELDNGQCGDKSRTVSFELPFGSLQWKMVCDALNNGSWNCTINDRVRERLDEDASVAGDLN